LRAAVFIARLRYIDTYAQLMQLAHPGASIGMFGLDKIPTGKAENAVLKLFPLTRTLEAKFQSWSEISYTILTVNKVAVCIFPFLAKPRVP